MRHLIAPITASALLFSALPAQAAAPAMSDIAGHWAREHVMAGVAAGFIAGYPDGTFRPDAPVTRAEFFKMLGAAMRLTPSQALTGLREQGGANPHWAFTQGHVPAAVSAGLIYPPDYGPALYPDTPIKRREIVLAAVRALGKEWLAENSAQPLAVPDATVYAPWLQTFAAIALGDGIITGYTDGTLGLERPATRAEAVVMVQRILSKATLNLTAYNGPAPGSATRHPGEGEVFWSVSYPSAKRSVISGGDETYSFTSDATDVRLMPAPGKAVWAAYTASSGASVIAWLSQGQLTEVARLEGRSPDLLAVGDDGRLWATDGASKLLVFDRSGKQYTIAGVAERLQYGGFDWNGQFWGIGAGRLYRVSPEGEAASFDVGIGAGRVDHFQISEDGSVWLLSVGPAGQGKARAIQVVDGAVARQVELFDEYYGGLGADVGARVVGGSGPFLWVAATVKESPAERLDGIYRLDILSGAFARQVVPSALGTGSQPAAAPDGGALIKDTAGKFWRILP